MNKKYSILIFFIISVCIFWGISLVSHAESIQRKIIDKYGDRAKIIDQCGGMIFLDRGPVEDSPQMIYVNEKIEFIGNLGGVCYKGTCPGVPKEWQECIKLRENNVTE